MLECLTKIAWKKVGLFAGGVLFGTAGLKILGSRDAKKVYTECTAAVLRCKDAVLEKKDIIVENCNDIYEGAVDINTKRDIERREREFEEAKALIKSKEESTGENV